MLIFVSPPAPHCLAEKNAIYNKTGAYNGSKDIPNHACSLKIIWFDFIIFFLISMHFLSIWQIFQFVDLKKKFFWKMFFVDRDFLFQQLASLIGIVKQHIRNYLDDIFDMIKVQQHLSIYLIICLSIHLSVKTPWYE